MSFKEKLKQKLIYDIEKLDKKIKNTKYVDSHVITRYKAFKQKSKEILKLVEMDREDKILNESIITIKNFCRSQECVKCLYFQKEQELCALHNPSAWDV